MMPRRRRGMCRILPFGLNGRIAKRPIGQDAVVRYPIGSVDISLKSAFGVGHALDVIGILNVNDARERVFSDERRVEVVVIQNPYRVQACLLFIRTGIEVMLFAPSVNEGYVVGHIFSTNSLIERGIIIDMASKTMFLFPQSYKDSPR